MKAIYELDRGECRWPTVCIEDKGQIFCAAESVEGRSYCAHHGRMSVASGIYAPIEPTGEVVMPSARRGYSDRGDNPFRCGEVEPDLTTLIVKGDGAYPRGKAYGLGAARRQTERHGR